MTYISEAADGAFIANLGDGRVVTFKRCPDTDFTYIDLDDHRDDDKAVMLLQSVSKNMEGYSKKEVVRAVNARNAQASMEYVAEGGLKTEVSGKFCTLPILLVLILLTQNKSLDQPTNV